jgi:hypothetical protein
MSFCFLEFFQLDNILLCNGEVRNPRLLLDIIITVLRKFFSANSLAIFSFFFRSRSAFGSSGAGASDISVSLSDA